MHLVLPFASPPLDPEGIHKQELRLTNLERLLGTMAPVASGDFVAERPAVERSGLAGRNADDLTYRLTPPHERVLATAWGWQGADGTLPWAAHRAAADGIDTGDAAWGLLSPVHWHVGREHLTMGDPEALALQAGESRAFLDAVRPLFESEGWRCEWGAPTRWYVAHPSLDGLPTASLDRVIGRNPDLWMPAHPAARPLRRLQSELQMLFHAHPLNAAREAAGCDSLNSVWLSGCGRRQAAAGEPPQVLDALRAPALRGDRAAWSAAWQAIDAGPLRAALEQPGQPLTLSLCGERRAITFERRPRSLLARLQAHWRRRPVAGLLAGL